MAFSPLCPLGRPRLGGPSPSFLFFGGSWVRLDYHVQADGGKWTAGCQPPSPFPRHQAHARRLFAASWHFELQPRAAVAEGQGLRLAGNCGGRARQGPAVASGQRLRHRRGCLCGRQDFALCECPRGHLGGPKGTRRRPLQLQSDLSRTEGQSFLAHQREHEQAVRVRRASASPSPSRSGPPLHSCPAPSKGTPWRAERDTRLVICNPIWVMYGLNARPRPVTNSQIWACARASLSTGPATSKLVRASVTLAGRKGHACHLSIQLQPDRRTGWGRVGRPRRPAASPAPARPGAAAAGPCPAPASVRRRPRPPARRAGDPARHRATSPSRTRLRGEAGWGRWGTPPPPARTPPRRAGASECRL